MATYTDSTTGVTDFTTRKISDSVAADVYTVPAGKRAKIFINAAVEEIATVVWEIRSTNTPATINIDITGFDAATNGSAFQATLSPGDTIRYIPTGLASGYIWGIAEEFDN